MSKSRILQVRLSETEKRAFEEAAQIAGISLSAWARERLRSAAVRDLENVGRRAAFLIHLPLELSPDE